MTNKITKRDYFSAIIALAEGNELPNGVTYEGLADFAQHEIDLLDSKRTSTVKKPTKTQVENEGHKATIMEVLINASVPLTIKEIQSNAPALADFSTSKMSALLSQLIGTDKVEKTYEKKVPHYSAK